jgi:hypothetical protein
MSDVVAKTDLFIGQARAHYAGDIITEETARRNGWLEQTEPLKAKASANTNKNEKEGK